MNEFIDTQFANYRLIRALGRGNFADVYLGEHIHLKTLAAVKILHVRLSGSKLEDFTTEARSIARLEHRNIATILDFNVQENIPYLVMTYAPKGSLRKRHPLGSMLPLEMIVAYVKDVAAALDFAHTSSVLHHDIKPENMLLARNNEVLLSDFRISVIAQSRGNQTTPPVTGTLAYMAPEQIQGRPQPASDQYALGIVTYEWLCGSLPFKSDEPELRAQHQYVPPPPLSRLIPSISPATEAAVMKALAKEPNDRYQNVEEFAKALEATFLGTSPSPIISLNKPVQIEAVQETAPNAGPVPSMWISPPTIPQTDSVVRTVPDTAFTAQEQKEQIIHAHGNVDYPTRVPQTPFPSENVVEIDPLLWNPETLGLARHLFISNRADIAE